MNNKNTSPTIEQSLKMIEEKLSLQKGKKKQFKTNGGKEKKTEKRFRSTSYKFRLFLNGRRQERA